MKKGARSVLMICVLVFGIVGLSNANGFVNNGRVYACVNNNLGTMKIVDINTAPKPYCGPLEKETLVAFQAYTGSDYIMRGHISSTGGQSDAGDMGYSVYHYPSGVGRYEIDFNISNFTYLPTCVASSTTAQCKVTSKTFYSVFIDCVAPTVSGGTITYVPVDTDFDFICID